jgi:hypothetical protein
MYKFKLSLIKPDIPKVYKSKVCDGNINPLINKSILSIIPD